MFRGGIRLRRSSSNLSSEGIAFRSSFRRISMTTRLFILPDSLLVNGNCKRKVRFDIAAGNDHSLHFGIIMDSAGSLVSRVFG